MRGEGKGLLMRLHTPADSSPSRPHHPSSRYICSLGKVSSTALVRRARRGWPVCRRSVRSFRFYCWSCTSFYQKMDLMTLQKFEPSRAMRVDGHCQRVLSTQGQSHLEAVRSELRGRSCRTPAPTMGASLRHASQQLSPRTIAFHLKFLRGCGDSTVLTLGFEEPWPTRGLNFCQD